MLRNKDVQDRTNYSKIMYILQYIQKISKNTHNLCTLGEQSNNHWQSYYLACILPFVFSTLQAVQDKLDDPFDGMGEVGALQWFQFYFL